VNNPDRSLALPNPGFHLFPGQRDIRVSIHCGQPPVAGSKEGWELATAAEFAAAEVGGWVFVDASG